MEITEIPRRAELIAVGSELLGQARLETNSLLIAGFLSRLGVNVNRKVVVGDDSDRLAHTLQQARSEAPLIFITGGLGPTADDITREVVAHELNLPLTLHQPSWERLQHIYQVLKLEIRENSRRQAMAPEGAVVLQNDHGTAPGLYLETSHNHIFLLPGPPRELEPMMVARVMPLLEEKFNLRPVPYRTVKVASLAESAVDAQVEPLRLPYPLIDYTILSNPGLIEIILQSQDDGDEALAQLEALYAAVRAEFGPNVYSTTEEDITQAIGKILLRKSWSLVTAESCTGGLIGKLFTDQAGSSHYYAGGIIAYSNRLKEVLLSVSQRTLEKEGAVSLETAREMAAGACEATGSAVGFSITGIAGPDGGSDVKPVGTVCFGLCQEGEVFSIQRRFPGDRASVRLRSAHFGLDWMRRKLIQ